ncbi:recombinase family protein [Bdellovibrionota bacterium FG-1]
MAKRVFGYIRRSIESDNLSLQAQERSIRSFTESQSWELVYLFCDRGDTGSNTDRNAYQQMLTASVQTNGVRAVDLILVPKLDRISRSLKDILILIEDQLDPLGIGLKSVTESFDSSTSEGRLMLSMLGGFAEFERKRIVQRLMEGKYELAAHGGWNGGPIPYGYSLNPHGKGLVWDPIHAEIVRQLFHRYANQDLSIRKLKLATGCELHPDSIGELLSNPFYVGWMSYGGNTTQGTHPPITSARLFNRVQERKMIRAKSYETGRKLFKISGMQMIPLSFGRLSGAT